MEIHHLCRVAIAPLRKEPSDRSEIVSQLLFGDRVTLLEKTEKWARILTLHDHYEGWIDPKQLEALTENDFKNDQAFAHIAPLQLTNTLRAPNGGLIYLSPSSSLPFYQNGSCLLGNKKYEVQFSPYIPSTETDTTALAQAARFFENVPYLWGGRSLFGIDCSGFVQTVYRLHGHQLQRDASQQVEQGTVVDFLSSAKPGDLAFFDNEDGKIIHVGLMLGNNQIIHASGMVRIDPIDGQGIYNHELARYTHRLRIIKRLIN